MDAATWIRTAAPRPPLQAASPNPFRELTTFRYSTPEPGWVELLIYDPSGPSSPG